MRPSFFMLSSTPAAGSRRVRCRPIARWLVASLLCLSATSANAQDATAVTAAVESVSEAATMDLGQSNPWGPSLGARLPMLKALDQQGVPRSLENLAGSQGVLLLLVRSADW